MKKIIYYLFIFHLFFSSVVFCEQVVIDDFNKKSTISNSLGGKTFSYVSYKDLLMKTTLNKTEIIDEEGACLQIDYNVELPYGSRSTGAIPFVYDEEAKFKISMDDYSKYSGFVVYLSEIPKKFSNFKKFGYLVLYLKGDNKIGFTRSLNVELKDDKRTATYTIEGITDEWQKFSIPLSGFTNINLSKVNCLGLCFSSDIVTKKSGRIYVDNIYLSGSLSVVQQKLKINKAKTEIILDGDFSEWGNKEWIELDNVTNLEIGKVSSKKDLNAKFALQYDENYLYVAINVIDNEIINREIDEDIWKEDCVEIFIDPQNNGLIWQNEDDFQIGIAPKGPEGKLQTWAWFQQKKPETNEVYTTGKVSKKGYEFEIAISWKFLGVDPNSGQKFGLSIAVNDFDLDDGSSGKLNYCFVREPFKEVFFLAETILK